MPSIIVSILEDCDAVWLYELCKDHPELNPYWPDSYHVELTPKDTVALSKILIPIAGSMDHSAERILNAIFTSSEEADEAFQKAYRELLANDPFFQAFTQEDMDDDCETDC